jgi:hypothetical protein
MATQGWLTTREIKDIFAEEVEAAGGRMSDVFDDGARIFLRAVLAGEKQVQPRDRIQGGVAVRATSEEIKVHPYVFRQVCSNGAIRAHALESRQIRQVDFPTEDQAEVGRALREAVQVCCCEDAFAQGLAEMRSARGASEVDLALTMMPFLARIIQGAESQSIVAAILDQFFMERDHSRFGMMNAVTSVARNTQNPEVRWRLEEIGARIGANLLNPNRERTRPRAKVLVRA